MAQVEWPSSLTAELIAYTQRLQADAVSASERAVSFIHERTVARARLNPDWAPLADNIEVWSQDGVLVIGVRDEEFVSEAFALEYGDEVRPPSPLFRSLGSEFREAGEVMQEEMEARYGYGGRF
jgi:hypothetical protein